MGREQGSATILGIIVVMLLGLLGTRLVMLSNTDIQIAVNQRDGIAAQYLAEAGIQYAVVKLKTDPDFIRQTEKTNHIITSKSLGTMPTSGCYQVQIGPDQMSTNINARLVTARGVVNQAQRQIIAHVTLPLPTGDNNPFIVIWND